MISWSGLYHTQQQYANKIVYRKENWIIKMLKDIICMQQKPYPRVRDYTH